MKRVLVIGSPGAGKSTFARKLAAKTGLPLYYLDRIWHKPDRTTVSREQFDGQLTAILERDKWIIDGNYMRTLPLRLKRCDTVFLFDLPLEVCLRGAEERIGKERADMPWIETGFDAEFRRLIIDFPTRQLPSINELLEKNKDSIRIIRFRTRGDADGFIDCLPGRPFSVPRKGIVEREDSEPCESCEEQ